MYSIQKEVGEIRSLIQQAKWTSISEDAKIQMLKNNGIFAKLEALPSFMESKMSATIKSLVIQMEKLEQTVKRQAIAR